MLKPTCCWIKTPASPSVPAVYCGKAVPYNYDRGADGVSRRKYATYCAEHEAIIAAGEAHDKAQFPTLVFSGQLEIDCRRGVIYFHDAKTGTTVLRICSLGVLPASLLSIDITHKIGLSIERELSDHDD